VKECICSSCANLKSIFDENGDEINGITEVCEFGFPSEECIECELDGCDLTCAHYEEEIESEEESAQEGEQVINCAGCGKALKSATKNNYDNVVYCVDCYLSK